MHGVRACARDGKARDDRFRTPRDTRESGLVARREDGHKWVYYTLSPKGAKLFKPQFYSWTILLTVSIVAIAVGGMLSMASFSAGAPLQYAKEATSIGAGAPAASAPPAAAAGAAVGYPELMIFAGFLLVVLGILGIVWVNRMRTAMRKQA